MTDDDATVHGRRTLHEGFVDLVELDLTYPPPDGGRRRVVFADPRPAAAVVPVRADGSVVLVRQYRPAVGRTVTEIPAGGLDGDEQPAAAAERELREELGLVPGRLRTLGVVLPSPGTSAEEVHLFAALDCRPTPRPEGHETVEEVVLPSLDAALALIPAGSLPDAKTQLALLLLRAAGA